MLVMKRLLASTALVASVAISGCSSTPPLPTLPVMTVLPPMPVAKMATPPPPAPPADGLVRYTKADRVGATMEASAGADRIYRLTIGAGNLVDTPPEIKWVELPQGEIYNETICDNNTLYDVQSSFSGVRNPTYLLVFKALQPELAPRRGDCRIMTSGGNYQIRLNVVAGLSGSGITTVRLKGQAGGANAGSTIAPEALCQDTSFTWQRTAYWAPMSVCATPDRTVITLDPRTQSLPVVHRFDGTGWTNVNVKTAGKTMTVMGVHSVLRLMGEGGSYIDITRATNYPQNVIQTPKGI